MEGVGIFRSRPGEFSHKDLPSYDRYVHSINVYETSPFHDKPCGRTNINHDSMDSTSLRSFVSGDSTVMTDFLTGWTKEILFACKNSRGHHVRSSFERFSPP